MISKLIQRYAIVKQIGWKAALRLWYALRFEHGKKSLPTTIISLRGYPFPISLRPGGSDPWVAQQVFIELEYEIAKGLSNIEYIVDCDANIGCTSIFLLHAFPSSKLLAIEPDPGNMDICRKNLQLYGDRVKFLQAGLWSSLCPLKVERGHFLDGTEWSYQVRPANGDELPDIMSTTIPNAMAYAGFPRIDLLKMDIEGAEAEVFSDASISSWMKHTSNIIIETHGNDCHNIVHNELSQYNYEYTEKGELKMFKNLSKIRSQGEAIKKTNREGC